MKMKTKPPSREVLFAPAHTHPNSIRPRLSFRCAPFQPRLFSYFPPSFVLIFAREPSDATSIAQAPFRFSTSLRPSRCIAVRHPCFDSTTEGGKRIFNTNESKHPTRRGTPEHVAYFANRKQPRFIEPRRRELPIRSSTHSCPNVPTRGKHCFKPPDQKHRRSTNHEQHIITGRSQMVSPAS